MIPAPIRLPDPRARMTPTRKGLILMALRRGEVTRAQVLSRYRLSDEELASWLSRSAAFGVDGLAINKLQELRT